MVLHQLSGQLALRRGEVTMEYLGGFIAGLLFALFVWLAKSEQDESDKANKL